MGGTSSKEPEPQPEPPKGTKDNPIEFSEIEEKINTGDLAVLYRGNHEAPNLAIFIQHEKDDADFPLLLVKGKTKPLPQEKFNPGMKRSATAVSATTRIFYGDYHKVAVQHLQGNTELSPSKIFALIEEVQKIPFSEKEIEAIKGAESAEMRSAIMNAYMVAQFYKQLGVLDGEPSDVTPTTLGDMLKLSDPVYVNVPPIKKGPMLNNDPPLLSQLLDEILPPPDVTPVPYKDIEDTLKTGDLVLFSGCENSGSVIKLFDQALFTHVGLIIRSKYTSQVFVWETATNNVGVVDVESGSVQSGVQLIPLKNKIFSGWYNRVVVRRLTGIEDGQREEMYKELLKYRKEMQGRPYEKSQFELIIASIDFLESYLDFLRNDEEDLSSLFCSELVAEAYQRLRLLGEEKSSSEYVPDDFTTARGMKLKTGDLEEEVYIKMKFEA